MRLRMYAGFIFILVLMMRTVVFAGDFPEAVLISPEVDVFIGEITVITNDEITIEISETLMAKYEVPSITVSKFNYMTYDENHKIPKIGDYCAVAAEYVNNRWCIFSQDAALVAKSDSLDTNTLKLYTGGFEFTDRMNKYINDGTYKQASISVNSKNTPEEELFKNEFDKENSERINSIANNTEMVTVPSEEMLEQVEAKKNKQNALVKYITLATTSTVISYCLVCKMQRKPLLGKRNKNNFHNN